MSATFGRVHGTCLESIENGPHPADASAASTRWEHLPRPIDVLRVVDFVLGPSHELVERGSERASLLIDRLLGHRFEKYSAKVAHRPSLTGRRARSYGSTTQDRVSSVAAIEQ